jgi:hypothetical protein
MSSPEASPPPSGRLSEDEIAVVAGISSFVSTLSLIGSAFVILV